VVTDLLYAPMVLARAASAVWLTIVAAPQLQRKVMTCQTARDPRPNEPILLPRLLSLEDRAESEPSLAFVRG
jgi:hypothetical protein